MAEKKEYKSTAVIKEIVASPYKYGFTTDIETEDFPKGINIQTVHEISRKKEEPSFLLSFRERGFKLWAKMKSPVWAYLNIPSINYQDIQYYSIPKTKKKTRQFRGC
jgi:Fe-S cluster assembly protein SufB